MVNSQFKSAIADIKIDSNNFFYVNYFANLNSLENAQAHKSLLETQYKQDLPLLILSDIRRMKKANKEVRDYFASAEMASICKARAILVGSGLSKVIGNLFIKFSRPKNPTKIFSNKEKALAWLATFK